ncbi:MAG: transglutaminase family protein [Flavobacteriales bacterium]|nr:transglutaminase family protein [Flavobacteriales bacterium]
MDTYRPEHLTSTFYIDSDNPAVVAFAEKSIAGATSNKEKAVKLYYAVRDGFRYNPYNLRMRPEEVTASHLLAAGDGHCIDKAIFLAACARAVGIPSRLEFADVINHISSEKFVETLKSDIFAMHGITQLFVDGKWVKCTPAFNKELCEIFNVEPLEFDGEANSMFHEFDKADNKFMEYVAQHGVFDDFPHTYFVAVMVLNYPHLFSYEQLKGLLVTEAKPATLTT